MKLTYAKVSVMVSKHGQGSPVACIYLPIGKILTTDIMQSIASEHSDFASDTVFCSPCGNRTFSLSFFSAGRKADFRWPALIGCMYYLFKNTSYGTSLTIATALAGNHSLSVHPGPAGSDAIFHPPLDATDLQTHITSEAVAGRLGFTPGCLNGKLPIHTVNAGQITLLAPLADHNALQRVKPGPERLGAFLERCNVDNLHVFASSSGEKRVCSKVLNSKAVAGSHGSISALSALSALSAMTRYLQKYGLLAEQCLELEHTGADGRLKRGLLLQRNGSAFLGGKSCLHAEGQHIVP